MNLRLGNFLTLLALGLIAAGLFLAHFAVPAGQPILLAGCIAFVVSIIATTRYSKNNPLHCPHCGEVLTSVGRRYKGGVFGLDGLDGIPCPNCGAVVSSEELLHL